jgi:tetratricopeptide (TPR) repeat protein
MLKTNLNNLIARAKLKEAIELFKSQKIEDSEISTGLNTISQSYFELEKGIIIGNIDKEAEARQKNAISYRLQMLVNQLPDDKPTPAPFRNVPTDYDTHSDIAHLSKRPRNHAENIASLGKYMPELDNRVKDLKYNAQFDDMATTSAAINRVIADVFNPFLRTVADSTHLRHLEDEVNFKEIAFTDELMHGTRLMIAELREHPTPESRYKRNLVISALTLSLVRKFDNTKFYVLSDFIADAEPFVWKRALVGLHFALSGREEEIDTFLHDKLKRLCANEDVQKVLEDIEIVIKNKDYELADKADNPFSNINNDPFFKASPHNWFMEFRADHPSVKTAIKNAEVLSLLEIAPDLPTNAFRYAFALNYSQFNTEQKKAILDKAKTRKVFIEKRYPSVKDYEKSRENVECEKYTKELYFFYKMYNQDEYKDLLNKNISLYDSSLRDILFSDKCQNRISARIDYIEKKYESASEKLLKLNDNYENDLIPALIGHCYLQHNDYEKALHHLRIAHTIEPLDIWNMNQIGFCYYSIANYSEALIWFTNANKIDNSNAYYLNHIGACYYFNENKDYNEAIKWFLKAYEIDNDNAWNLNRIGSYYYFNLA